MKNIILVALFSVVIILFGGCGSISSNLLPPKPEEQVVENPEIQEFWNTYSDSTLIIGHGFERSNDPIFSYNSAQKKAFNEIGKQIAMHFKAKENNFKKSSKITNYTESGDESKTTQIAHILEEASSGAINVVLTNAKISKIINNRISEKNTTLYECYVLAEYPKKGADKTLLDWISSLEKEYDLRVDSLEVYKEMVRNKEIWLNKEKTMWESKFEDPVPIYAENINKRVNQLSDELKNISTENKILILDAILFPVGVTEVLNVKFKEHNTSLLQDFIKYMKNFPPWKYLLIVGHADITPLHPDEHRSNLDFAEERAESVKIYLQQCGLKGEIRTIGVGTLQNHYICLLYTSPSPRDRTRSRMPSSA